MFPRRMITAVFLFLIISIPLRAKPAEKPESIDEEKFERLHQLIKPGKEESRWMEIDWYPSVWEARKKAAEEGKPIFFMAASGGAPVAGGCPAGRRISRRIGFWTDQRIELIRKHFIAVSVPTWLADEEGPVGQFLRKANIDKKWLTSSGYKSCVSASGKYLGDSPSKKILEKFKKLPKEERAPGAVEVPDLDPSEKPIPSPPEKGLVLRVHARFLSRGEKGQLRRAEPSDFPSAREKSKEKRRRYVEPYMHPNTEYMWLTREEENSLIPDSPETGQTHSVPSIIAERMARFHLVPPRAMTSQGTRVKKHHIQTAELSLVVRNVTEKVLQMDLKGFIEFNKDQRNKRREWFRAPLYGRLEYDRKNKTFTRFDIVAPGDVRGWKSHGPQFVERPGWAPFGFAFELATLETPTDRIPPGGKFRYTNKRGRYLGKSR